MNGFLNMLKPPGMSSSDVVSFVKRRLPRGTRVGHGGTLDPDAAGVLPICVGRATRLFDYIIDKQKQYIAELRLGVATDTQDASGHVISRSNASLVTAEQVQEALPAFIGDIEQIPPAYSAIKRDGQRMYDLARKGQAVELTPRAVHVDGIDYLGALNSGGHLLRISCRKGVYIRTLCHDIGAALGVGGHMAFLLRSRAGYFDVSEALTLEELDAASQAGTMEALLTPPDAPLSHFPAVYVTQEHEHSVKNGNPLKSGWYRGTADGFVRVYLENRFAGMGQADEGGLIRFRALLLEMNE